MASLRTIIQLFIHHTYLFFSFSNLHISDLYTHNCLYCILCFCYLYIILLSSMSCRCHSVASVTIPNSNKAHSDSDSSPKNEDSGINYIPSCRSKPVSYTTQIKIFVMASESSQTLHRQQGYYHNQRRSYGLGMN